MMNLFLTLHPQSSTNPVRKDEGVVMISTYWVESMPNHGSNASHLLQCFWITYRLRKIVAGSILFSSFQGAGEERGDVGGTGWLRGWR